MDAKTIGGIIAIAPPTITLTLTLLALFKGRLEKNTATLDTPSLKILCIQRYPIHNASPLLKRYIILNILAYMLYLIPMLYSFALLFWGPGLQNVSTNVSTFSGTWEWLTKRLDAITNYESHNHFMSILLLVDFAGSSYILLYIDILEKIERPLFKWLFFKGIEIVIKSEL